MSMYSNRLQPALQNLLQHVVQFFHPRSSCTTHISADVRRITLNASCMTISGGRTKQLDIFCRVTGFTSDFLSFIVVELIQFFHGAIQLSVCIIDRHSEVCTNVESTRLLVLCHFGLAEACVVVDVLLVEAAVPPPPPRSTSHLLIFRLTSGAAAVSVEGADFFTPF